MEWLVFLAVVVAGFLYIRHKILTSPLPKNMPVTQRDPLDLTDPMNAGMIGNVFNIDDK